MSYAAVSQNTAILNSILPDQIRSDPIIQTVIAHAQYVSAQSTKVAAHVAGLSGDSDLAPDIPPPRLNLGLHQFGRFARMVSENVLRHTPNMAGTAPSVSSDAFWTKVKAYYKVYFDGKFNNYFGMPFDRPTISTTIGDTEIVQATSVFLELIMDEIFHSPVWKGSTDGNYYPGGNKNLPSALTINGVPPQTIPDTLYGCGMNVPKATTIRYLSQAFTKVAEAESNLTIKSVGGIEIGFGILGK